MKSLSLGFIGGGRVARILLEELRRGGAQLSQVIVADPAADVLAVLKQSLTDLPVREGGLGEVAQTPSFLSPFILPHTRPSLHRFSQT